MATLPPVPYKSPLASRTGLLNTVWEKWFRELFERLGGSEGATITDLSSDVDELQSLTDSHEASINALSTTSESHTSRISDLEELVDGLLQGPVL
jgi:hypothetical protein